MARNYFVTPKWQYSKSVTARARRATKTLESAIAHMWNTATPHPTTGLAMDDWNTEAAHDVIEAAIKRVWLAHDDEQKDAKVKAEAAALNAW